MLRPQTIVSVTLLLLFFIAPTILRERGPSGHLATQIDSQLQTISRLVVSRPNGQPDPQLFGALVRLEEMLPRSTETRLAQQRGRKAYFAMVNGHSAELARMWPALRGSIEKCNRQDTAYMQALAAVDRRLGMTPSRAPLPPGHVPARSLPFDQMRPGDIMLWDDRSGPPVVRVALALFAEQCTHSAIYLGKAETPGHGTQRWTLEAQSPALGVRTALMGRKWTRPGLHVSLGHVNGFSPGRAAQIAEHAVSAYGGDGRTPYHVWPPWDKTYTREGLYCSQLVWTIYDENGVDLDSNDWRYLAWFTVHNWFNPYAAPTAYFAVFPDEIKRSPYITWYYDQVNR